jgi:hypothetical protein
MRVTITMPLSRSTPPTPLNTCNLFTLRKRHTTSATVVTKEMPHAIVQVVSNRLVYVEAAPEVYLYLQKVSASSRCSLSKQPPPESSTVPGFRCRRVVVDARPVQSRAFARVPNAAFDILSAFFLCYAGVACVYDEGERNARRAVATSGGDDASGHETPCRLVVSKFSLVRRSLCRLRHTTHDTRHTTHDTRHTTHDTRHTTHTTHDTHDTNTNTDTDTNPETQTQTQTHDIRHTNTHRSN